MAKERYQNPTPTETVRLRLFVYNSNSLADVSSIEGVSIYLCDPSEVTMENPEGRVFVERIEPDDVVHECTGTYYVDVLLDDPKYVVGKYFDVWTIKVDPALPEQDVENQFRVYTQLWYTTPMPVVYDFSFDFQPNKIRKGSKQYIRIRVTPNVPKATDLMRYYENLAVVGNVKVSLEQKCGACVPAEEDLRLILDEEPVCYKEKCLGFYQLDTEDLDCGVYAIWFTLELGGNKYISDKMNLQLFS